MASRLIFTAIFQVFLCTSFCAYGETNPIPMLDRNLKNCNQKSEEMFMEITLDKTVLHINGKIPKIGDQSPDFSLVGRDLSRSSLKDFHGVKLLMIVPSLDTEVCFKSLRRFSENVDGFTLICISADLPFASNRICEENKITNVHTLSMMNDPKFAADYGILIADGCLKGLSARAIFVLDDNNNVIYKELVKEITQEPNYDEALSAALTQTSS